MNFIGLVRSVEELLYEVMTWLVFYPRTLIRVLRHPLDMIDYSDREQDDVESEQYTDTLSPPIFLMLSILICHGIEIALGQEVTQVVGALSALFSNSEETLLLFRMLAFSIYPLVYAVGLVKRSNQQLDRKTLREPFFSQCYLGALLAILVSGTTIAGRAKSETVAHFALGALLVGLVAYIVMQAIWLRLHLPIGRTRAALVSIGTFLKGTLFVSLLTVLFSA